MPVIIDEVDASIAAPPAGESPQAGAAPATAAARSDADELRAQLALLDERGQRLRAD